jgi:thiamine biosynthesis lipoprotein
MKNISVLVLCALVILACKPDKNKVENFKNTSLSGPVFGTGYSVVYDSDIDFTIQLDSLFDVINLSMSTYIPTSEISKLNRNESYILDAHFENVFNASKLIYEATDGAFDPTIGDVVNAWSFGADKNKFLTDSTTIDSIMKFVGFNKVHLTHNKIEKQPQTYLEFNAIAKGYGVDVVALFLESYNIKNYLVNIGGEIRVSGINIEKNKPWTVGLDQPRFDGLQNPDDYVLAVELTNESMATSGTYRKFKIDNTGNRYAHIMDTKTGYPSKTNILSVSVIAESCMIADGYATAFQAMGIEKVTAFLKSHPELKVFFIFENDQNEFETLSLNNFSE